MAILWNNRQKMVQKKVSAGWNIIIQIVALQFPLIMREEVFEDSRFGVYTMGIFIADVTSVESIFWSIVVQNGGIRVWVCKCSQISYVFWLVVGNGNKNAHNCKMR